MKQNILNVQPQSLEAEQAVLGSCLSNKLAVEHALEKLLPKHFYKDSHSKIFSAMISLYSDNKRIDTITVVNTLKKNKELEGVGGAYYVTGLVETTPTTANVKAYIDIVYEKAQLRELILLAHEISAKAYDDREEPSSIIELAEKKIYNITAANVTDEFKALFDLLTPSIESIERINKGEKVYDGVLTGLEKVDQILLGLQKGNLIIVAGRPSMGKTSLALQIAVEIAKLNGTVGIFSYEMTEKELTDRILYTEAMVDSHVARSGKLNEEGFKKLYDTASKISELPILLNDCTNNKLMAIKSQARRLIAKKKVELIIVDYLQKLYYDYHIDNRMDELTKITGGLKLLAKELKVPIMLISQLSRALESRKDKRPKLSDLRESGSIEQDADIVAFVYRDEVYFKNTKYKGQAEIIIRKNRNGPTGTALVAWVDRFTKFSNLSYQEDIYNNEQ